MFGINRRIYLAAVLAHVGVDWPEETKHSAAVLVEDLCNGRIAARLREDIEDHGRAAGSLFVHGPVQMREERVHDGRAAGDFAKPCRRPLQARGRYRFNDRLLAGEVVIEVPGLIPASAQIVAVEVP